MSVQMPSTGFSSVSVTMVATISASARNRGDWRSSVTFDERIIPWSVDFPARQRGGSCRSGVLLLCALPLLLGNDLDSTKFFLLQLTVERGQLLAGQRGELVDNVFELAAQHV